MVTLADIGTGLSAFGAGVQGRGQEFLQGREQQRQQKSDELRKLDDKRRQALIVDNRLALNLLKGGKINEALDLTNNRIGLIGELGGDPSDTTAFRDLIQSGDVNGAISQSQFLDDRAVLEGFLPAPTAGKETFKPLKDASGKVIGQISSSGKIIKDPTLPESDLEDKKLKLAQDKFDFEKAKDQSEKESDKPLKTRTTVIYKNGTMVQSTDSGPRVFDVGGERLKGQDARDAVKAGNASGIAQAGGEATAKAIGTVRGKGQEGRIQTTINEGVDAAKGLPILRRSLQLINRIETGGFDAAKLRAKQLFGVEGADEGELSANLGRTVLSQLKATFGAQFTEREGARLERMSAGFGKSTAANKRILRQSLKIAEDAANRALDAARKRGDTAAVDDLLDFLDGRFDLTDEGLSNVFVPKTDNQTPQPQTQQTPTTTTTGGLGGGFGGESGDAGSGLGSVDAMTDEELRAIAGGN